MLIDEKNNISHFFFFFPLVKNYSSQPPRKQEIQKSYAQALAFPSVLHLNGTMISEDRQERKKAIRKWKSSGIQVSDLMFQTFWNLQSLSAFLKLFLL